MEEAFGARVKRAREHAGLSQSALANAIDVKQQAIQFLEKPENNARGSRYTSEIARVCGVDARWLATGQGTPPAATVARAQDASYKTTGQRRARGEAEKLLFIIRTFLNTGTAGQEELYAQALQATNADESAPAAARVKSGRGKAR